MTPIDYLAPAKLNLTLHVTGQRADGYHLLDSLVAFCAVGDVVRVSEGDGLTVDGPLAAGVPTGPENSVLKAAAFFGGEPTEIHLTKNLPHAAGIGGGSADAAATLRALSAYFDRSIGEGVEILGADVPVCLTSVPSRMQGIGEVLTPLGALPETHLVLVNPGVAVETPPVFRALAPKANTPMPDALPSWATSQELAQWLATMRNDLEAPAKALFPIIDEVLGALNASPGCLLARMSGSGATCFGIYPEGEIAGRAAEEIAAENPDWWVAPTVLLNGGAPPRSLQGQ